MVNVQKRLKGASVEADFWHGENLHHLEEKKAQNWVNLEQVCSITLSKADFCNNDHNVGQLGGGVQRV